LGAKVLDGPVDLSAELSARKRRVSAEASMGRDPLLKVTLSR
jgi:hypothetical protein